MTVNIAFEMIPDISSDNSLLCICCGHQTSSANTFLAVFQRIFWFSKVKFWFYNPFLGRGITIFLSKSWAKSSVRTRLLISIMAIMHWLYLMVHILDSIRYAAYHRQHTVCFQFMFLMLLLLDMNESVTSWRFFWRKTDTVSWSFSRHI